MAVTNAQIVEFLLKNPGMSDADIVKAMETYKISPAQMAETVGLPVGDVISKAAATVAPGNSVTLGDTRLAPQYDIQGSGENQQIGGITNITVEKTTGDIDYQAPVGSVFQNYSPTGEFTGTGVTQKANNLFKEFALGAGLLFGGAALAGFGPGAASGAAATGAAGTAAGAASMTAAELAAYDLALGGVGGTTGATQLANALATGATVPTALNLTGGSGVLTGEAAGITADSVAKKLAADAATQFELTNAGASALTPTGVPPTGTPPPTAVPPTGVPPTGTPPPTGLKPPIVTGVPPVIPPVADLVKTGLTAAQIAQLLASTTQTAGGLLQQQTSKEAADKARVMIEAETAAAKTGAQFRPVGMTTRFGSSQFAFDPKTGQLTSAGYTLSPEAKAAQDRFVKLAEAGLTQAEGAQKAFEPLQTGAQSLFTLGNKYLAQSPEQVASDYLKSQMALLQPGRELELANLQNKLQQQGRSGLSVAQGGSLGATTPELQALFNARAQQEAILAANAQKEGQQNVLFGSGLLTRGASTLSDFYTGQKTAYTPYTTALGEVQNLETAGQQPFTLSTNLGALTSAAGARAGELGLRGAGLSTALATGADATRNPYASAIGGITSNPLFTDALTKLAGGSSIDALDFSKYGKGNAGFEAMLKDIYG